MDVGSWYHLVWTFDSAQDAEADRSKCWMNGVEQSYRQDNTIPEDLEPQLNNNVLHGFGRNEYDANSYYSGYLAEYIFIDGTALDADSFGETNSDTGQWVPKKPAGLTYGTNGFWLDFANSSALGNDVSGNNNDWATSGLAADDQVVDTPTTNYCNLNILRPPNTNLTFSEGSLKVVSSSGFHTYQGTFQIPATGKWYCEIEAGGTIHGTANWDGTIGIGTDVADESPTGESTNWQWGNARTTVGGEKYNGSSTTLVPASSLTSGSIVMMAIDMDNSKIWWGVDGSWMGTASGDNDGNPATGANPAFDNLSGELFPTGNCEADTQYWNFGQLGFAHTPPSGFEALNTVNLDDPIIVDPSAYMQGTKYTGNGDVISVTQSENSTFEPDFIWFKRLDATSNHQLTSAVMGVEKRVESDNNDAIGETGPNGLRSFDSTGFTVGENEGYNADDGDYIAWQWIEGSTPGFDVVKWTGNVTNRTIAHSLSAVPAFMVVKNLGGADNWVVYHQANTAAPATEHLQLNTTAETADSDAYWNDTAPTSSVFTVGINGGVNDGSQDIVGFLWSEIEGFSKFSSYVGNNATSGPFVFCGFTPAFVMIKRTDSTGDWPMKDVWRSPDNEAHETLYADTTAANFGMGFDILSNGFKIKTTDPTINASGGTYIYMAWAKTPFKTALAR